MHLNCKGWRSVRWRKGIISGDSCHWQVVLILAALQHQLNVTKRAERYRNSTEFAAAIDGNHRVQEGIDKAKDLWCLTHFLGESRQSHSVKLHFCIPWRKQKIILVCEMESPQTENFLNESFLHQSNDRHFLMFFSRSKQFPITLILHHHTPESWLQTVLSGNKLFILK